MYAPLVLAIAAALCCSPVEAHAAPARTGRLPLDHLHPLLGGSPLAVRPPATDTSAVAWFTDQSLLDDTHRLEAIAAYRGGLPVAIVRGPATAMLDRVLQGAFGAASPAALAVYVRTPDGSPHIHEVAELPEDDAARARLNVQLAKGIADSLQPASAAPQGATPGEAELIALPRIVYTDTRYASTGNGAVVTVRGEFLRNSGRTHDIFTVSASTVQGLKPHHNGVSGDAVIIPGNYHYYLRLFTPDNSGTSPKLSESRPLSSPATTLNISESHTTKTSYGFGLSREVSAGLQGKVPSAGAKTSFSFDFGLEYSTTNALAFSVNDYALTNSASSPLSQTSMVYWDLPLAPHVATRADYFGTRPTVARVTPSMRQVSAQGSAVWFVPGTYRGNMTLTAGGRIDNLQYDGRRIDPVPDPRPQPTAGVTVAADSPYLTREVTVFIQSKAGNGGCLRDQNGVVRIAPCPDTASATWLDDLHAQWQLDSNGRYYNRGSRKCMQILTSGQDPTGSGEIITRPCTTNRDQRWEWQADRIHTLHGDGHPEWRLFVGDGDFIGVRTAGKPQFQSIPANPFHPLLNPWSSYPRAPTRSDFYPKLENLGPNPPVSDEIKQLAASPANERWELIVLRQSLHR
ncbi:RICIN domain-containing protein [Xanthomonas sp. 60]